MNFNLHLGDCLETLKTLPDCSVDSVITDPPYGLSQHTPQQVADCLGAWLRGEEYKPKGKGFMGKSWDAWVPSPAVWRECLRVLKPGGHLLAFAGTRSMDLMSLSVRLAGFELRDSIGYAHDGGGAPLLAWAYGSGFPKSLDVSKAIDKAAGADESAKQWQGWGTALKPALETVTFASKPYTDEQVRDIIQSNLFRLEARLWLLSSANAAGKSSTSNQSEYGAACAIAQWNADEITSTQADLCGQMGTSLFALATTTSLNIVSSWRRTLDESWSDGSTSTIETKSSTTIDWRTLKFSVSQITPASIIKACSLPGGFSANASTAESHFNASLLLLQSILTLSVTEPVISLAQHEHQGAGVTPNLDPVVLARKPLEGTVAENVLKHGTGALNIDASRIMTADQERDAETPQSARWPANLIHDGSDAVMAGFPSVKTGVCPAHASGTNTVYGDFSERKHCRSAMNGGDSGSAARFFFRAGHEKEDLLFCRAKAILSAWKLTKGVQPCSQENASVAESSLCLSRQAVVSVLSDAVIAASRGDRLLSDARGLSTTATESECERLCETLITAMLISESVALPAPSQDVLIQNGCHVNVAAIQKPTDTMTITISLPKSGGYAEHVTFSIMPSSMAHGARGLNDRFRYCAKASKKDRDDGNIHPTVKPTALMRYLCRLVTPPSGTVLDPFTGSGSTGKAAILEGFNFIGCEMQPDYHAIAHARISAAANNGDLLNGN